MLCLTIFSTRFSRPLRFVLAWLRNELWGVHAKIRPSPFHSPLLLEYVFSHSIPPPNYQNSSHRPNLEIFSQALPFSDHFVSSSLTRRLEVFTGNLAQPTLVLLREKIIVFAQNPLDLTINFNQYMMSFNVPKRQPTSKQSTTQSDPHPSSGLMKVLIDTGRTKGSSATPDPPMISPTPNRGYQSQIERMNNASHARDNQSQDVSPANVRYGLPSQRQGLHNRDVSFITQQSVQSGGYASRSNSPGTATPHFRREESRESGQETEEVKFFFPCCCVIY